VLRVKQHNDIIANPVIYSISGDRRPVLGKNCWVAPGAHVMGDVVLGDNSSVWFNTTIRGDMAKITIGENSNIQDGSVLHAGMAG
jgi:carbonic anhydrase/acetyltransferase-like protein (isoleucine patch superfamily)